MKSFPDNFRRFVGTHDLPTSSGCRSKRRPVNHLGALCTASPFHCFVRRNHFLELSASYFLLFVESFDSYQQILEVVRVWSRRNASCNRQPRLSCSHAISIEFVPTVCVTLNHDVDSKMAAPSHEFELDFCEQC